MPIDEPNGKTHFRLLDVDGCVRLEQFDETGKFVRLVHWPQDDAIAGASYETSDDRLQKVRRSNDGAVRFYDEYQWPDDTYSDEAYPQVKVFNEHGRLIAQHRPERISETTWDIHVFDALGKRRGAEPCTIHEEWME